MQPNTQTRRTALRHRNRWRGGNAILEMAIVMPVLMYLAMGMVEYGQYVYLKHAFEMAARDGARVALVSGTTQAEVVAAMTNTLAAANVTYNPAWAKFYWVTAPGANAQVTDLTTISAGFGIEVTLSAQYSTLPNAVRPLSSLIPAAGIGTGKQITGTCTVIRE